MKLIWSQQYNDALQLFETLSNHLQGEGENNVSWEHPWATDTIRQTRSLSLSRLPIEISNEEVPSPQTKRLKNLD
ncbi:hypothetical protein GQ602_007117 [Ophiocordyceps camponoti-floridani]|uniref:Uncharacterized protein n=1 Tax=Ophiocordyceps camponoti-floridani TaxID=2030778 RepID=A0A8H4Q0S0_9HYPO|nr:hypothetical protein GQ602_007117 [Ophiocordyceps camponoti-floridani]